MADQIDKLLTQQQAMQITGMSSAWFEMNRHKGKGIPWIRMGRAVRYRESDLKQFILDNYVGTGI